MRDHNKSRTGRPKRPAKAHGEAPQDPEATPHTEAVAQSESHRPESVHSVKHLTQAEQFKILRYVLVDGMTQKHAAQALGRAESTISEFLSKIEVSEEYAAQILRAATPDAATRWAQIAKTSKNHIAAKDLLLHTGVIKPLEGESGGAKVLIQIGQPGAPVSISTPQVIDAQRVTSTDDSSS